MSYGGAIGLHRGNRQEQQDQLALTAHPAVAGCMMGVVADGMGGKTGGRMASEQAVFTSRQLFSAFDPNTELPATLLGQIAEQINKIVGLTAVATEEEPHTTLAIFLIMPDGRAHWAHCGDSRIYHFRGGHLLHRTKDHSYVQLLIDAGQLTEAQARLHPMSNLLTSCLGPGRPQDAKPTVTLSSTLPLEPGDCLVACSDGLWHGLTSDEMGLIVSQKAPKAACEQMVSTALRRGRGHSDNISVVVVHVLDADTKAKH